MTQSFRTPIKIMDKSQKEWFATAMVSMVLADGSVSQGEVNLLMESISFVREQDSVERLKKFIQFQTAPPLGNFIGWEKEWKYRAAMMLDLIGVAVADREFSREEKDKFYEIGAILGFPKTKIDELVNMGDQFMA